MSYTKIFLLLFLCLLTACKKQYTVRSLVGEYVLSTNNGTDIIDLKSDGTYTHSFKNKGNLIDHQSGQWKIEVLQAGATISLDSFYALPRAKSQSQEIHLLLIKKSLGHTYLITNIDTDQGYEKIANDGL